MKDMHSHALADEGVVVLASVLFRVNDDKLRIECRDRVDVGIFRAPYVGEIGPLAKARACNRRPVPGRKRLGGGWHEADDSHVSPLPVLTSGDATQSSMPAIAAATLAKVRSELYDELAPGRSVEQPCQGYRDVLDPFERVSDSRAHAAVLEERDQLREVLDRAHRDTQDLKLPPEQAANVE
jgi:hypothetical protein